MTETKKEETPLVPNKPADLADKKDEKKETAVTGTDAAAKAKEAEAAHLRQTGRADKPAMAGSTSVSSGALAQDKETLISRIRDIEKEFDGNTSNIPINHEYWDLMNAFRRKAR